MRICLITSEAQPFASTGGLGDVAAALPDALTAAGHDVFRIMPLYRQIWEGDYEIVDTGLRASVPLGPHNYRAEFWVTAGKKGEVQTPTFFVRRDEFFDRRELYGLTDRDYDDNLQRFLFFQKAAVVLIDLLEKPVDIVHCNDWQTGLVPLYLKYGPGGLGRHFTERTVFTIHNLAFQGVFPGTEYYMTNLPLSLYSTEGVEFYDQFSFMKAGIITSSVVTTVSETYAKEIQTEEFGCGMDGILRDRGHALHGIVNGIDTSAWNPETDAFLPAAYSSRNLDGKLRCRQSLAEKSGLKLEADMPLLGMVSRLSDQKGLDLIEEIMPSLMTRKVCFVLLGKGQEEYHELVNSWNKRWPNRFKGFLEFNLELAHQIEGGADIFLMPSRFEPCGLNQLYSQRYGTLPVVHATGGLQDTITDITDYPNQGNGFKFTDYHPQAFLDKIHEALDLFAEPKTWNRAVIRAMELDYSWTGVADKYIQVYESAV